jgi:hypothetical protein
MSTTTSEKDMCVTGELVSLDMAGTIYLGSAEKLGAVLVFVHERDPLCVPGGRHGGFHGQPRIIPLIEVSKTAHGLLAPMHDLGKLRSVRLTPRDRFVGIACGCLGFHTATASISIGNKVTNC